MKARFALVVLGLLVLQLGCGCPEPSASVETTTDGDPSFAWFGTDAYSLAVTGPDGLYWSLQCTTGQSCFSPPVEYGQLPTDTAEIIGARPLDRGTYEVTVCAICGDRITCGEATTFDVE